MSTLARWTKCTARGAKAYAIGRIWMTSATISLEDMANAAVVIRRRRSLISEYSQHPQDIYTTMSVFEACVYAMQRSHNEVEQPILRERD